MIRVAGGHSSWSERKSDEMAPLKEISMNAAPFADSSILVVGGAGFVGSNLLSLLLPMRPRRIVVVDNLLSADNFNLPERPEVDFRLGSIADDRILDELPVDLDFVYHLACYHGNQSSIHDPLADHDNNTLTTLKLFDRLKALTGNPTPIALAPARDWDRSGRRFGAPDKARERLEFVATTRLRDGLRQTFDWTRTNLERIRAA